MRLLLVSLLLAACTTDVSVSKGKADADGDGYAADIDCDDTRASVHPDAVELCDDLDNDCDGALDEDPGETTWYADADGDGYGDRGESTTTCYAPEGYVADGTDCDDASDAVHPAHPEICDGLDNDCDGRVDTDAVDMETFAGDADGDGFGDPADTIVACEAPAGYAELSGDCDDEDAAVHPEAPEEDCTDPVDYNCDGSVAWADDDGDGWAACEDCDDADAARNPAATEVCDPFDVDEDCSGVSDDGDPGLDPSSATTWTRDADSDGYGATGGLTVLACDQPLGYVADAGDCDDADARISPAAAEVCDVFDTDEDCDGAADDADTSTDPSTWATGWYDADGDGYGDPSRSLRQCDLASGYVANDDDCDDALASVSPAAAEVCDERDNDCDGLVDDADPSLSGGTTVYADRDGDGYGDPGAPLTSCDAAGDGVANAEDCDDTLASVSPDAEEICEDGIDNNCDGADDDDCSSCEPGGERVTLSTLNYDGMSYYPLDIEDCTPRIGPCCGETTTQQQMDAFCQLAGYCEAETWTVETIRSTSCYCLGECTGWDWASPCCSGSDDRNFVTEVVCR